MATQRLRSLCTEMYKTLNQLNPGFTSNIFKLSSSNRAAKRLRALGHKTWNNPPPYINSTESLSNFKFVIKFWEGLSYQCNLC